MRTTLDIDDDILVAAKELAHRQACSLGRVVSQLTCQALTQGVTDGSGSSRPASQGHGNSGVGGYGELCIEQRVFCLADAARRRWPSGWCPSATGRQEIPLD